MGGYNDTSSLNDVWKSTNGGVSWEKLTDSAGWSPRYYFASFVAPDSSIVLLGGTNRSSVFNDEWRSTDGGKTWALVTATTEWAPRCGHSSNVLPDGSGIIIGGMNNPDHPSVLFSDVWKKDFNTGRYMINSSANNWSIIVPKGKLTYPAYSNPGYLMQAKPGATMTNVTIDNETVGKVGYWTFSNLSADHSIHVDSNPTPGQVLVFFNASPRSGTMPLVVNFYDQSLGKPTSWYWQFGDGVSNTTQNPQHIYNIPGVYTVTLRAMNEQSGGTGQWNDFITITS